MTFRKQKITSTINRSSEADSATNADVSLGSGDCEDCGGTKKTNWSQVFQGSMAVIGGSLLTGGGILLTGTGVATPLGVGGMILGPSTIGLGTANIIEGFRGGQKYPTGPLEAIDVGLGGDGTIGQIGDTFSGGLPKSTTSGFIMGYQLYNPNIGQKIINNSSKNKLLLNSQNNRVNRKYRQIQKDNTQVRKPHINY